MSEWEPNETKLANLFRENADPVVGHVYHSDQVKIAQGIAAMYQSWLAAQCGPDPCVRCDHKAENRCSEHGEFHDYQCERIAAYQGQQAGYAKAKGER